MKKQLLLLFVSGLLLNLHAQKETDNWFFGVSAGLDFTSGVPAIQAGAVYSMPEGCASMSTSSGTLLFYSDGSQVWNANHQIMPNGSGLHGEISSTQSCIIVPKPASATQYYIFTTAGYGDTAGFKYSIIDMTLDGGLGDVTATKNIPVLDSVTEKLCAIRTTVGGSYWIMIHKWDSDAFYAYELTASGLQAPVISNVGTVHTDSIIQNTYGQMKFNMCGTKLGCSIAYMDLVEIFDFNASSGVVSNPLSLSMTDHVYGFEFSPNSNLIYVSCYDVSSTLLQYNLTLGTLPLILASRTPLTATPDIYGLQIASDGKIYCARSYGSTYLGVINFPDIVSTGCNYVDNGANLDTTFSGITSSLGLPGFMQTYLKNALSIVCPGAGVEDEALNGIGVYPNPSADEFFMNVAELTTSAEVYVYDYAGKEIARYVVDDPAFKFGQDYKPGVYFVMLRSGNASKVFKVIKT